MSITIASNAWADNNSVHNQQRNIVSSLIGNKNAYALLYFVQPGCVYCQQQTPVINEFQRQTGWYVKTIDIVQNPEVRSKFNISGTPVLVLIKKNSGANNWQTISIGFSPLDTLQDDVYKLLRLYNGYSSQNKNFVLHQSNTTPTISR
ncbi:thiol reductase thioredoxin [Pectobacterium carotovorum subsp. carotovorum]|nr:thiol reductase thioredoxin [Pectobacterium carotovorum subsp. carotovorum]